LGDNQVATCNWNSTDCNEDVTTITSDGFVIGTCSRSENPNGDSCEDDGLLSYSWDASWVWDSENNYTSNQDPPEGYYFEAGSDGYWHLTDGSESQCLPGSRMIPCPAQVKLPYFDWKNLVITIIILGLIYLTLWEIRKGNKKLKK